MYQNPYHLLLRSHNFSCIKEKKGQVYQLNNSVTFSGKPIGSEEFLNRMDETLGIAIDRRTKRRFRKMES